MKTILVTALICISSVCFSQSIVGTWQMVKHTSCLEDEVEVNSNDATEVLNDMKKMSGATPQILQLKENNTCEESTKIINRNKSYNSKSFMYRYNGEAIYFLDKRSHTIIEGYVVEKMAADSLIISNSSRACDTKIFVRIK
jgi:hypothetical protein